MRCPYCHLVDDRVVDTRNTEDGYMIRRKRLCMGCKRKFVTVEKIEKLTVRVVKSNLSREPLDREKIRRGIERACSKRQVSSGRIEECVQEIESAIYARYEDEVSAEEIGEIVMENLKTLDDIAYIRFTSVYREFADVKDFMRVIGGIANAK